MPSHAPSQSPQQQGVRRKLRLQQAQGLHQTRTKCHGHGMSRLPGCVHTCWCACTRGGCLHVLVRVYICTSTGGCARVHPHTCTQTGWLLASSSGALQGTRGPWIPQPPPLQSRASEPPLSWKQPRTQPATCPRGAQWARSCSCPDDLTMQSPVDRLQVLLLPWPGGPPAARRRSLWSQGARCSSQEGAGGAISHSSSHQAPFLCLRPFPEAEDAGVDWSLAPVRRPLLGLLHKGGHRNLHGSLAGEGQGWVPCQPPCSPWSGHSGRWGGHKATLGSGQGRLQGLLWGQRAVLLPTQSCCPLARVGSRRHLHT
ncbi:uncharacterized protein LOC120887573 [Ictidomys tridecemlineatus]